jgi:hypothetical protein
MHVVVVFEVLLIGVYVNADTPLSGFDTTSGLSSRQFAEAPNQQPERKPVARVSHADRTLQG